MAIYDKETKFYWLQIQEDFFEQDAISILEDFPNGIAYSNFYLKMCLKSLKNEGVLIRRCGDIFVPYDDEKLAALTHVPIDTVRSAMQHILSLGLAKILENGEIYLTQVERMVGSQSIGAFKKQQQLNVKSKKDKTQILGGTRVEKIPLSYSISISDSFSFSDSLKVVINKWLQHKRERKQAYKETGLNTLLKSIEKKVAELGEQAVIDSIEQCIARNYSGIFYNTTPNTPQTPRGQVETVYQDFDVVMGWNDKKEG